MLNHPNKNKSTTKKQYSIQVLSNQQNLDCCINLSSFYAYSDLTPESIEVAHDTITIYLKVIFHRVSAHIVEKSAVKFIVAT